MNGKVLVASAEQKLVRYPLVEAGHYQSIYEAAYRDLESESRSMKTPEFEAKVFSLEDLGIGNASLLKKFLQLLKRPCAGEVIETIQGKIRAEGWRAATLAYLVAYEAQHLDKHGYSLFAPGLFYAHMWTMGSMCGMSVGTRIVPFIRKTETGRCLDQYVLEGSFEGVRKPDDTLLKGYFLGVR